MSIRLHLSLNKFINIFRLIAPLFLCGMTTWPPNAFVVLILLIFFVPLFFTWLIPVDCITMGCTGRMRIATERLSFWRVKLLYKCDCCGADYQAEIFNPNIVVTSEYS